MATKEQIDSLRTSGQKYAKQKYNHMYIGRDLTRSEAFRQLSGTSIRVYLFFLGKRNMKKFEGSKQKRSGKGAFFIANNGEIQFTYKEAEEKYGISSGAFRTAIDRLVKVGLIDIAMIGSSIYRHVTKYAISERWRLYGTNEFIRAKRPRAKPIQGFSKKNRLGINAH